MDDEEDYSEDRLMSEITKSLLNILKKSPGPELMNRCFEQTEVENEDDFKEMMEKKLRICFRKLPKAKKKPIAAGDAPETKDEKQGEDGKKQVKEEEKEGNWNGEDDESEFLSDSDDEFNSLEDTDFEESDFHSDDEARGQEGFMSRQGGGGGWLPSAVFHFGGTPPPPSHPSPPPPTPPPPFDASGRDEFDSSSHYGTPPKMPRLDMQNFGSGDWSSDDTEGGRRTPQLSYDNHYMNGSGCAPMRPGSPAPWTSHILPTARRILGELPLAKDEFDSDSDDDVSRPSQSSNIPIGNQPYHHSSLPYPTATVHSSIGNTIDANRLFEFPLGAMPQDENNPRSTVGMARSLPPSVFPPIGVSSSSSPLSVHTNRDFSHSNPTVSSSSIPNPPRTSIVFDSPDDPDFDSQSDSDS